MAVLDLIGSAFDEQQLLRFDQLADVHLVHDYLTQRGGAERVVLSMMSAFPDAPVHTSLYEPGSTYPRFRDADIRPAPLNGVSTLRRNHRLAFPLLARSFSRMHIDAEMTLCSSSGWAHGVQVTGRKVVYCHNPARWLYQRDQYLGAHPGVGSGAASSLLGRSLRRWDHKAALSADRYIVNSTTVQQRVQDVYGIEAEVLHPPPAYTLDSPQNSLEIDPGYWLCVSRLLAYKNVDQVIAAFGLLSGERLIVVGRGPEEARLKAAAPANVTFLDDVNDSQLAWLYANCRGLVAASHEDFGLTPLEANVFGKPVAALRWGGHLDTVVEGMNGVFFDEPTPAAIGEAIRGVRATHWAAVDIAMHAAKFSEFSFAARLRDIVREELALV